MGPRLAKLPPGLGWHSGVYAWGQLRASAPLRNLSWCSKAPGPRSYLTIRAFLKARRKSWRRDGKRTIGSRSRNSWLRFCAGRGNPNGAEYKDDVRCAAGNCKVVPKCFEDLDHDNAGPRAQSLGDVAHFAAGYHLRPSYYSCCRQRVAAIAPEPWGAARCVRRGDIPGAFSLVDRRGRSSTGNETRPSSAIPKWQAGAHAMVWGRYPGGLLRRADSCLNCFAL